MRGYSLKFTYSILKFPRAWMAEWSRFTCTDHCSLSLAITYTARVRAWIGTIQKLTRIARDKVCQLDAQGQWLSPGTPVSSSSKTDRRHITEIFLKVAFNPKKQTKIPHIYSTLVNFYFFKLVSSVPLQMCVNLKARAMFVNRILHYYQKTSSTEIIIYN